MDKGQATRLSSHVQLVPLQLVVPLPTYPTVLTVIEQLGGEYTNQNHQPPGVRGGFGHRTN